MLTRVVSDPVWTGSDKVFLSSVIVFPYDEMTEIIHKPFFMFVNAGSDPDHESLCLIFITYSEWKFSKNLNFSV